MTLTLKSLPLVCALGVVCPSVASAAILVEELFDYYPAQTAFGGRSGGVGFKEAWWTGKAGDGKWTLGPNSATVSGTNNTWAGRAINPIGSDQYESIYFTFDIGVSLYPANASGSFVDLVEFRGDSAQAFGLGIGYESWGYYVRLRTYGGTTQNHNLSSSYTTASGPFTITGKLTFGAANEATLSVWVNPQSATEQPSITITLLVDTNQLTRLTLQRGDSYNRAGEIESTYGPIRIGTDWYSIHPSHEPAPIPEPASVALLGGVFAAGVAALRRRRR
jgi:PEP-CTERM putative exosortase interaction domain